MIKNPLKTPELEYALAGESRTGATQSDRFPERIARYGKAKDKALDILNHIIDRHGHEKQYKKLINDMTHCGNYLLFRDYYTVGEIRLKAAHTCKKHLLCPLCAIRRGAKLVQDYHQRYITIMDQNPRLKPYLVTFTVKDGENLAERFKTLYNGIRVYHERRHRKNASCEALKAFAAVWSYEIKRGRNSGLWHPHVHAVWLCETPPDQYAIQNEWASIIADGSFMCDVTQIDMDDPVSGFLEVFKYATKFSDQANEDTFHTWQTLQRRRLIGSFGAFRGIKEPTDFNDELLPEELPYIDRLYHYRHGIKSYELMNTRVNENPTPERVVTTAYVATIMRLNSKA